MASIIDELKNRFRRGNLCIRLIYVTVALFVVCQVAEGCMPVFSKSIKPLFLWLVIRSTVEGVRRPRSGGRSSSSVFSRCPAGWSYLPRWSD